ncbi:Hsp20/alpha crystallin family protein [Tellurirhabdus rosea]|uniref:Hsp20/alpha crystallin family protein n=1 Tax=Tellurirhabdus rosea TaxID=2674997 RepID=UPI0022567D3B|nr:Hsp20/alpha crystallin family protein [Tellurirhabdus rosea]
MNIEETPDTFDVYVAAPGRAKEAFGISVQDDVLTISFQPVENEAEPPRNWRQREFAKAPFERSFFLNGKVDSAGITATYQDGILHVTLPKSPAANEPPQQITIA